MTCESVHVKQGRSGTLKAILSKDTTWDNEIWNIEELDYSDDSTGTEGQVLKHKIMELETIGVYRYTVKIMKQGSSLSCNGTLLVYSK